MLNLPFKRHDFTPTEMVMKLYIEYIRSIFEKYVLPIETPSMKICR